MWAFCFVEDGGCVTVQPRCIPRGVFAVFCENPELCGAKRRFFAVSVHHLLRFSRRLNCNYLATVVAAESPLLHTSAKFLLFSFPGLFELLPNPDIFAIKRYHFILADNSGHNTVRKLIPHFIDRQICGYNRPFLPAHSFIDHIE